MPTAAVARVVFDSPLPALDREFEYLVPSSLSESINLGVRVKVPFARQTKIGFVVGLSGTPEYSGKLSEIGEVVSPIPVLQPHIYKLLREISFRQCCSVGELLTQAVPKRMVRTERLYSPGPARAMPKPEGLRVTQIIRPFASADSGVPNGYQKLAELACSEFEKGQSVIVALPDFRDVARFGKLIETLVEPGTAVDVTSSDLASEKYAKFLNLLDGQKRIVFGTRSVIYAPVPMSSTILVWEDSDQSHTDQQSPYLSTREIALLRQNLGGSNLFFLGYSRSTEVTRLVQLGYLAKLPTDNWRPKVLTLGGSGLDGHSFGVVKRALEVGPVLVQVAAPGQSRSLFCNDCSERSKCSSCNGPLWLNSIGHAICRWCGRANLDYRCRNCGGNKLRQGSAGATRWVAQLGKSFPGVPVREVTVDDDGIEVSSRPQIVVSTPGVEPIAAGGFAALLVIDGAAMLNRDSLRASEDALRSWLTALGFVRESGESAIIGISNEVEKALSLGEVEQVSLDLLTERESLGFPPSRRVLSAIGTEKLLNNLELALKKVTGAKVLGISKAKVASAENDHRLVCMFTYAAGLEVSETVREFLASVATEANRVSVKSGRAIRPVTIRFDDPQVI